MQAAIVNFVSGGGQGAIAGQSLAAPLAVQVLDQNGNPVSGLTVTFTQGSQPDKNSGVSFAGGVNTAVTNGSGIATSATMTAFSFPGTVIVQAWAGTPFTNVPVASASIVVSRAGAGAAQQAAVQSAWGTAKSQLAQLQTDLATVATDLANLEASRDTLSNLGAADVSDWLRVAIQSARTGYQPRINLRGDAPVQVPLLQAVNPNVPRDPTAGAQAPISATATGQLYNLS